MKIKIRQALFFALTVLLAPQTVWADRYPLSVQAVYGATGRIYTDFNPEETNLEWAEAEYINKLFEITDEAVRARYFIMDAFKTRKYDESARKLYTETIGQVMADLSALPAPTKELKEVETIITDAIMHQYQFIANFGTRYENQSDMRANWRLEMKDERVQKSHDKLVNAVAAFNEAYPFERQRNQMAFLHRVKALSFLK